MGETTRTSEEEALAGTLSVCLGALAAGRSSESSEKAARRAADAWGLQGVDVFAMGTVVTVQCRDADGTPISLTGSVANLDSFDCDRMTQIGRLGRDIRAGSVDGWQAVARVAEIKKLSKPWWWTLGGGMLLAFCVSLQVMFSLAPALLAVLVYVASTAVGRVCGGWGLPRLFTVAAQASVAGLVGLPFWVFGAMAAHDIAVGVAVTWMLLVPLPQIVSAAVDGVHGDTQASLVRLLSLAMAVGGIALGVYLAVAVGRDPNLPDGDALSMPTLPVIGVIAFSVLGSVGNALANAGGRDLLLPAVVIGLGASSLNLALQEVGFTGTWASSITAICLGIGAAWWARHSQYSATALALIGLTGALLPGLTVYRGIYAELGHANGWPWFLEAAGVAAGLGLGVAFGFTLVRLLTRRQHPRSTPPLFDGSPA